MRTIPIRDLKDTDWIETLCSQENGPVLVTENGYGCLVVMDIEYYERTMRQIQEAAMLTIGLDDAENGRLRAGADVISEMKAKAGN